MTSRDSEASTAGRVGTETSQKPKRARSIQVNIRGQKLSVRSDREPEFVQKLADHIDEKVAALQQAAPAAPLSKLLMLASMTVAEDLFEARARIEHLETEIGARSRTLLDLLDQVDDDSQSFDPDA